MGLLEAEDAEEPRLPLSLDIEKKAFFSFSTFPGVELAAVEASEGGGEGALSITGLGRMITLSTSSVDSTSLLFVRQLCTIPAADKNRELSWLRKHLRKHSLN
jgi:hypothetical protein